MEEALIVSLYYMPRAVKGVRRRGPDSGLPNWDGKGIRILSMALIHVKQIPFRINLDVQDTIARRGEGGPGTCVVL